MQAFFPLFLNYFRSPAPAYFVVDNPVCLCNNKAAKEKRRVFYDHKERCMLMYEKIEETVIRIIADTLAMDPSDITSETKLVTDLKVDSVDYVEICVSLEDEFNVSFDTEKLMESMTDATTVANIVDYLVSAGAGEE